MTSSTLSAYRLDGLGLTIIPAFLGPEEVASVRAEIERLGTELPSTSDGALAVRDAHRHSAVVEQVVHGPPVRRLAEHLLDSDDVQFVNDRVFIHELGRTQPTPWHQDQVLTPGPWHRLMVAWFDLQNGAGAPLRFAVGSHRSGRIIADEQLGDVSQRIDGDVTPVDEAAVRSAFAIAEVATRPGDVVAFDGMTAHASRETAVRGGPPRIAMSVRYGIGPPSA